MERLRKGKFFGNSKKTFDLNGLTVVDSEFSNFQSCPWHYHENAHFAFTTGGHLVETHRKEKIRLSKGFLMFNYSQDPHFNSDYSEQVSALHIDIDKAWFEKYSVKPGVFEGVIKLYDPALKHLFLKIDREVKNFDDASPLAIEGLVLQALAEMMRAGEKKKVKKPAWAQKAETILNDRLAEKLSLKELALETGLHPVYLSQQFPLYFNDSFGEYLRKTRIRRSLSLFPDRTLSLAQIAYLCGFSDQSHFTRCFRAITGTTPAAYRELLKNSGA